MLKVSNKFNVAGIRVCRNYVQMVIFFLINYGVDFESLATAARKLLLSGT